MQASANNNTLLVKNAQVVVTMNDAGEEIRDGGIYVRDNEIVMVGAGSDLPSTADEIIDLTGHILIPGLINTHHHMYQSLTRAVPLAQNAGLFTWLKTLYPIWSRITPDMIYVSSLTAMAELILSGCTTSSDHLYIFPHGCRLDDSLEAAAEIGLRFHATRGSMSVGESDGGLPPDGLVEDEAAIINDCRRLIETYHDSSRYAMQRIAVAPCSPFSVSNELMRESAALARSYDVGMHTHLAENVSDVKYSRQKYGMTPAEYVQELDWLGSDVWHAHCVQLDQGGIDMFARTGTGVAHCPSSNMRLASGVAPVRRMLDRGVNVGLGVDGSASNDAAHLLIETRQAMLLQRVVSGADAMHPREALKLATRGGAAVLQRDDIGCLAPGKAADFVAIALDGIHYAGALHDPVAALVLCGPTQVAWSVINGRVIVREGRLQTLELRPLVQRHNDLAAGLIRDES